MLRQWSSSGEMRCLECARTDGLEVEGEEESVQRYTLASWERCQAADPDTWVFYDSWGVARPPLGGSGIPDRELPMQLWKGWCEDRQGLSHPNMRFMESLEACGESPEPHTLEVYPTGIVTVPWWDHEKVERVRRVLGVEPPIEQGPPPNYEVELPPSMEGLFEPQMLPHTYARRVRQMEQACGEFDRQRRGLTFRMDAVTGGREGVSYGPWARKEEFRHLVFRNHGGRPEVVRDVLPDRFTDMNLEAMLRLMAECDEDMTVLDWEIGTEIALYGMRSMTACTPTTNAWLLYKGGIEQAAFLQANRDKQRTGYATPRVSPPERYPRFEPERIHPKSVETVQKPDGTVKHRETTDYGAWRVRASQSFRQWRVRMMARRVEYSRKGRPGPNSFNACLQQERVGDLKWGSVYAFAEAMDVLLASGVPVDAKNDDFQSFFPQFPLWVMEQWMATQLLDSTGAEINERPDFGGGHLPVKTSRCNYNVVLCQDIRLWRWQLSRQWALAPWSRRMVAAADEYASQRQARGYSGRFWFQFAWIDDNSAVSLRVFSAAVRQVRYDVWRELRWICDEAKSTEYLYGQLEIPATVGVELDPVARRMALPVAKMGKYEAAAMELCAVAEQHPRSLVPVVEMERVVGQLLHAADIHIEMWMFFMELICSIRWAGQPEKHTLLSKSARHCLREMIRIMRTTPGRPLTPYRLRPGADGLPVWLTRTDAGRNTRTFAGAIGGYFHRWDCEDVFFFAERLPEWLVQATDVTQLELHAADVAAELQAAVSRQGGRGGGGQGPAQYLVQTGDSQSVFRFVLNTMRARSPGMRPLVATRWQAWHGPVCGRGSRGMVAVVHGLGG
jgi:hypothetical protein